MVRFHLCAPLSDVWRSSFGALAEEQLRGHSRNPTCAEVGFCTVGSMGYALYELAQTKLLLIESPQRQNPRVHCLGGEQEQ